MIMKRKTLFDFGFWKRPRFALNTDTKSESLRKEIVRTLEAFVATSLIGIVYDYFWVPVFQPNCHEMRLPSELSTTLSFYISEKQIWISDEVRNMIWCVNPENTIHKWGRTGSLPGEFDGAHGVVVDERTDQVYVADRWNARIQVFTLRGKFKLYWKTDRNCEGTRPTPIALALQENELFVLTESVPTIQVYHSQSTKLIRAWGRWGSGEGEFHSPFSFTIFEKEVYIADTLNDRIQAYTLYGHYLRSCFAFKPVGVVCAYDLLIVRSVKNMHFMDRDSMEILYSWEMPDKHAAWNSSLFLSNNRLYYLGNGSLYEFTSV
jgi:hypothetical protein